jgi:hypothetical protein
MEYMCLKVTRSLKCLDTSRMKVGNLVYYILKNSVVYTMNLCSCINIVPDYGLDNWSSIPSSNKEFLF